MRQTSGLLRLQNNSTKSLQASCRNRNLLPLPSGLTALYSTIAVAAVRKHNTVEVLGQTFQRDAMTNVTPTIISRVGKNLPHVPHHPVNIIKQRIVHHFHKTYTTRTGNAIFSHFDDVSPIVTTEQNFDSLLVPPEHISRSKNDNYYINSTTVLRAHTSAHQRDFIRMGFDRFLVTGDVYRRDEIDSSHYPVFHQMEGVRLFNKHELFASCNDPDSLNLFEADLVESDERQAEHTIDAVKMM